MRDLRRASEANTYHIPTGQVHLGLPFPALACQRHASGALASFGGYCLGMKLLSGFHDCG